MAKKKIGLRSVPPKNEARPLGTKRPKKPKTQRPSARILVHHAVASTKHASPRVKKDAVDTQQQVGVELARQTNPPLQEQKMTLTFKGLSKNSKNAFYTGAAMTLRFPIKAFVNSTPPPAFDVLDGLFAAPKPKPRKLTKEERKAERDAKPKPTLAEKAAKAQKKADDLKAKLEAESVSM